MRIGSEVMTYRASSATTGVPRVMRETHRYLAPALAQSGFELVPVATSPRSEYPGVEPNAYVASDPILGVPLRSPADVDLLLLINASTTIDFAAVLRNRQDRDLPVVAMIHDILPLTNPQWFVPNAEVHFRVLCQQILHVADHVVVPSNDVADGLTALRWRTNAQIHVMHLGTSFEQRAPRPASPEPIDLLYVSTLEPRKGHQQLLDAFDLLHSETFPVRLTFVGRKGWMADDLARRVRTHREFGTSLRWVSSADDDVVLDFLQSSTVAVIPSEGEGFGLFLEEALSAGTMVVARDIPVFRERPNPNVLYFDGTSQGLADAIIDAARRTPEPLAPGTVRTMRDFAEDLGRLVLNAVESRV